jgi:hypothetical protein
MNIEIQRRYRESHREELREAARLYREKNRLLIRERNRLRYKNNPELQAKSTKAYRERYPQRLLDYQNLYRRKRRLTDPTFRLQDNLRSRIRVALRGKCRSKRTMQLVGCSIENLWIYLESLFEPGMTRENYGLVWHVDHIVPCAIFDLTNTDHQKRCFHFSNLQPLFASDNKRKSDKIL